MKKKGWGEYVSSSTNSLDQFAQTYKAKKKSSRRKSKASSNQATISGEDASSIAQVEPAESAQPTRGKSPKTIMGITSGVLSSAEVPVPVLSNTSKDIAIPSSTSTSSTGRYVMPKKGIQANRLNELARKVSPPARHILPKPPVVIKTSPPRNTSGSRPNPGQKKKK